MIGYSYACRASWAVAALFLLFGAPHSARAQEEVTEAYRGTQFHYPCGVSVDYNTGNCWVADTLHNEVALLAKDGTELWRVGGFDRPYAIAADPRNGTAWVADTYHGHLVHLGPNLRELWRGTHFGEPWRLAVDPEDGSVWVLNRSGASIGHLSEAGEYFASWEGKELAPVSLAVNTADGTCWAGAANTKRDCDCESDCPDVWILLSPQCDVLSQIETCSVGEIGVVTADGSVWADEGGLLHYLSDGSVIGQASAYSGRSLAVHPTLGDGSFWVAGGGGVTHVAADGSQKWRGDDFALPFSISLNYRDGSVWIADTYHGEVVHLVLPPRPFPDVPHDQWACNWIGSCAAAGIVEGYGDGLYHPERPVTRDQMAVYVSRALAGSDGAVPSGPVTATFPDVPPDHWAYRHIEFAVSQGVVAGFPDGDYRPTVELDRAQMAVFIARSICTPTGEAGMADYVPPSTPTFSDTPTGFWAYKYIEYIADPARAVVTGFSDGTYRPELACLRDQMAVYIARAFKLPPWPTAPPREEARR